MYKKVHKYLYAHERNFIFARIDCMRNDLKLSFNTYPTILIYPKDNKSKPITYDMIRDYEVFLNFLEDQKLGSNIYERWAPDGLKTEQ